MSAVYPTVTFNELMFEDFFRNFLKSFPEWHVARSIIKVELKRDVMSFGEILRCLSKYPPTKVGEELLPCHPVGKFFSIQLDVDRVTSLLKKDSFVEDPRRIFYQIFYKLRKAWEKDGVYWKK